MDLPPDFGKYAAGPVGSAIALLWLPGTLLRRAAMFFAGWGMAHFTAPALTTWLNLSPTFAGFLTGLFGVVIVSKLFDTWVQFDAGTILKEFVRKLLRLEPKV